MFFAASAPGFARRSVAYPTSRMLRRMPDEAARGRPQEPAATVEQDDSSITLRYDVPGVTREQLSIAIEGDVVRIQSREGAPRQYRMACRLPQEIAVAGSSAKLEHGVLTVRLVRQAAQSRATKVEIH